MLRLSRYERRDRKSAISLQHGQFVPKFQVERVAPPIIFARFVRPTNALQFCRWQFSHELCSRLSSSEVLFYAEIGRFSFLRPPLRDLGATYDDRLRLIGKRVVDFLLVLTELFSLGVTAEELRANIGWKSAIFAPTGASWPKISGRRGALTNHSSSQKSRLNDIHLDRSFFHFVTKHAFDGRTNGQTDRILIARPRLHSMQRGKK